MRLSDEEFQRMLQSMPTPAEKNEMKKKVAFLSNPAAMTRAPFVRGALDEPV